MTKNTDDLVYEAAGILGIQSAGEALSAEEYDVISKNIGPVLAEIASIVYVGDQDSIPDELFQTIARLVAIHSAAKFSSTPVDLEVVKQHEQRLRYLVAPTVTYEPLKADYF